MRTGINETAMENIAILEESRPLGIYQKLKNIMKSIWNEFEKTEYEFEPMYDFPRDL